MMPPLRVNDQCNASAQTIHIIDIYIYTWTCCDKQNNTIELRFNQTLTSLLQGHRSLFNAAKCVGRQSDACCCVFCDNMNMYNDMVSVGYWLGDVIRHNVNARDA